MTISEFASTRCIRNAPALSDIIGQGFEQMSAAGLHHREKSVVCFGSSICRHTWKTPSLGGGHTSLYTAPARTKISGTEPGPPPGPPARKKLQPGIDTLAHQTSS
jgi:hypothetical protein